MPHSLKSTFFRALTAAVVLALVASSGNTCRAQNEDRKAVYEKADALDRVFKFDEAIAVLQTAQQTYPDDAEILSRLSREYTLSMSDVSDRDEKMRRGKLGIDFAQQAVEANPNNPKSQICAAVSYGRLAGISDARTRISYSREVKKHAVRARELDPENDLPWHVLGVWNYELASLNSMLRVVAGAIYGKLPEASFEEAAKNLEKALALNPKRTGNYIELGRVYAAMDRKEEARTYLEKGLTLPQYDHDDDEAKRRGREALEKL